MKDIVVDDVSVKMISGNPDCKLCDNGVIFTDTPGEERLCECATLIDLNIPEDTLSKWTPVGQLINLPEQCQYAVSDEQVDLRTKKLKFEKPENFGEVTDPAHSPEPSRHNAHTPSRASLSSGHETNLESNESEERM